MTIVVKLKLNIKRNHHRGSSLLIIIKFYNIIDDRYFFKILRILYKQWGDVSRSNSAKKEKKEEDATTVLRNRKWKMIFSTVNSAA